jgi:hypothetical protein
MIDKTLLNGAEERWCGALLATTTFGTFLREFSPLKVREAILRRSGAPMQVGARPVRSPVDAIRALSRTSVERSVGICDVRFALAALLAEQRALGRSFFRILTPIVTAWTNGNRRPAFPFF